MALGGSVLANRGRGYSADINYRAIFNHCDVITALHGMQTRSCNENSVRLSVKRVNCDKTEEKSLKIFILYERSFRLVSGKKGWLLGATPST